MTDIGAVLISMYRCKWYLSWLAFFGTVHARDLVSLFGVANPSCQSTSPFGNGGFVSKRFAQSHCLNVGV